MSLQKPSRKMRLYWRLTRAKISKVHRAQYAFREFSERQKKSLVSFIILLMTISQLAINIYLPSMPAMSVAFHTSHTAIQFSLSFYLIGYGASQFFYGPLSDIYGRRWIILSGLSIFLIASLAATFANNIYVFWIARILQGVGIGCGDTMGRAILCDCFKEQEFVKAACRIGFAATIAPLVGPVIGGYVETWLHWRANFLLIFLYGLFSFILVWRFLPETKPRELFGATQLRSILNTYRFILKNPIFLGFFIPGLACFAGETIYSMAAPFLIQVRLGWSPVGFGWLSLFIIAGLFIGTFIANILARYINHHFMVLGGLTVLTIGAVSMLLPALGHQLTLFNLIAPMMIFTIGVAIIYPNTNMGALTPFTTLAGTAGALQGGLQMAIGGVLASVVGEAHNHTQLPLACALTGLAAASLLLSYLLLRKHLPEVRKQRA